MKAFFMSFVFAGRGVAAAVAGERNMRIHLCACIFVVITGVFEKLSATHWALELILCGAVLALELVNTALEALCDEITRDRRPGIARCKDAAAGAVLVLAAVSAIVWVLLLLTGPGYLDNLAARFQSGPLAWIISGAWLLLLILCVLYNGRNTKHDR